MSQVFVDGRIVYPNGLPPELGAYQFRVAASGSETIEGFFVDANGDQVTAEVELTVDDGAGQTFETLYLAATSEELPAAAVGFVAWRSSGEIFWNVGGKRGFEVLTSGTPTSPSLAVLSAPATFGRVN